MNQMDPEPEPEIQPETTPEMLHCRMKWAWSDRAKSKEKHLHACVWGWADREVSADLSVLGVEMDKWLDEQPTDYWRPTTGEPQHRSYTEMQNTDKIVGSVIMDFNHQSGALKVNIVMDAADPLANIDVMEAKLRTYCMLETGTLRGQVQVQDLLVHAKKEKGNHASQHNIIFRTKNCQTILLGLTKHGDTSRTGRDIYGLRHAFLESHGWSPQGGEAQNLANTLCHLVGYTSWLFGSVGLN